MGIPENIKKLRKNLKMTQKSLAESTGLSIGTIQGYEQGRYEPKIETIYRIADALGIPASEIAEVPPPSIIVEGKTFRTGKELQEYLEYCGNRDTLINVYENFLNEKGQKKLFDYAIDLSNLDKYRKTDASNELTKIPEYRKDIE